MEHQHTMASSMPITEDLSASQWRGGRVMRATRWLPVKDADVLVLKRIFCEMDMDKSKSIEVSEVIHYFSSHTEDKVMSYLSNHVHGFFNVIDVDKSGDITFEEFLGSVMPRCPVSQIRDWVTRLAPELDVEGKSDPVDIQVRADLRAYGEPENIHGETKGQRRLRLANVRSIKNPPPVPGEDNERDLAKALLQGEEWAVGVVNEMLKPVIAKSKPAKTAGVRVSFQWRSKEAKKLVDSGAAGRPLLSMDGVPLHSHPTLQLMKEPEGQDEETIDRQMQENKAIFIKRAQRAEELGRHQNLKASKQIATVVAVSGAKRRLTEGMDLTNLRKTIKQSSGGAGEEDGRSTLSTAAANVRKDLVTPSVQNSIPSPQRREPPRSQSVPPGAEGGVARNVVKFLPAVHSPGTSKAHAPLVQGRTGAKDGNVSDDADATRKSGASPPSSIGHTGKKKYKKGHKHGGAKPRSRRKREEIVDETTSVIEQGDAEALRELFSLYKKEGIAMDARILRLMMHGAMHLSRPDLAVHFFESSTNLYSDPGSPMAHAAREHNIAVSGIRYSNMHVEPDEQCIALLIEGHGRMGNLSSAMESFDKVSGLKLVADSELYNAIIRACVINNNLVAARGYIEQMTKDGLIDRISVDIATAVGDAGGGMLADYSKNKPLVKTIAKRTTTSQVQQRINMGTEEERRKIRAEIEESLIGDLHERDELLERIGHLELTLFILGDVDADNRMSDAGVVANRLRRMKERVEQLTAHIDSARATNLDNIGKNKRKPIGASSAVDEDVQDKARAEEAPGDVTYARQGNGADEQQQQQQQTSTSLSTTFALEPSSPSGGADRESNVKRTTMRVVLPSIRSRSSMSGTIDFFTSRVPFFVTKTMTATPKSFVSGEHVLIALLQPSDPVHSSAHAPVYITISGLTGLKTRDADFIPIYGAGGRKCTNFGGVWRQQPGTLCMQLAYGETFPETTPLTFRFMLHIDTSVDRGPITPTVEMSGGVTIAPSPMSGEVLSFTSSPARRRRIGPKGLISTQRAVRAMKDNVMNDESDPYMDPMSPSLGRSPDLASPIPHFDSDEGVPERSITAGELATQHLTAADFTDWGCDLQTGEYGKRLYRFDDGLFNAWRPSNAKAYICIPIGDMAVEREKLHGSVLPRLADLCREHLVALTFVDLRLGLSQEDLRQPLHLKLALDEAQRCHYFICMLGQQYGWHQPVKIPQDLFDAALEGANVVSVEEHINYQYLREQAIAEVEAIKKQAAAAKARNTGGPEASDDDDAGGGRGDRSPSPHLEVLPEFEGKVLPEGADVAYFRAQIFAVQHGHGWVQEYRQYGMMELEILHRLLPDRSKQSRSIIAIRSDEYIKSSKFASMLEDTSEAARNLLADLKKRVASGELGAPELQTYTQPAAGAESVGVTLERALRRDWLASAQQQNTELPPRVSAMENEHRSFALGLAETSVPLWRNRDAEARVEEWITSVDALGFGIPPFIFHGAPGAGLSAFLVSVWRRQVERNTLSAVILHVSEVDKSVCNMLSRACLMLGKVLGRTADIPVGFAPLMAEFLKLQAALNRVQKVLLVLDGASSFVDKDGQDVDFIELLPFKLCASFRLLLGVTTSPANLAHATLNQWPITELLPIVTTDREHLVRSILEERSVRFGDAVKVLTSGAGKGNMRLIRTVIDSVGVFGNLEPLGNTSVSLKDVWNAILLRSEETFGERTTRTVVLCLATSRYGLSRHELLGLLSYTSGYNLPGITRSGIHETHAELSRIPSQFSSGGAPLIAICGVLAPLQDAAGVWENGALLIMHQSVRSCLLEVCGVAERDLREWHRTMGEFFLHKGERSRVVREYAYHLQMAGDKKKLTEFLSDAYWATSFVGERLLDDFFQYWWFTGKSRLSACYTSLLPQMQCWGCMTRGSRHAVSLVNRILASDCELVFRHAAWVHEMIRRGMADDVDKMVVAQKIETELLRRSGRVVWRAEDIHVHITQHPQWASDETVVQAVQRTLTDSRRLFSVVPGAVTSVEMLEEEARLRFVVFVLMESLVRIVQRRHIKHAKGRVEQLEIMSPYTQGASQSNPNLLQMLREREVVSGLFRVLVFQDEEKYAEERTTYVKDRMISLYASEVMVDSVSSLGITPQSFFPVMIKIGEEVMSVSGVRDDVVIFVQRDKARAKVHMRGFLLTFTMRLTGEPSSYAVRIRLAGKLTVKQEHVTADLVTLHLRGMREERRPRPGESEYAISIWTEERAQAEAACKVLERDVFVEWMDAYNDSNKFLLQSIVEPLLIQESRPCVYAQVVEPRKTLAIDHYYCAYMSYLLDDKDKCRESIMRAFDIGRRVCLDPSCDHLVAQCQAFLWLLCVEEGKKDDAALALQEIVTASQVAKSLPANISSIVKVSSNTLFLRTTIVAAGRFVASNPPEFARHVSMIRKMLTPCMLGDMDASTLTSPSLLWMIVHVIRGRDFPAMDANGQSDPFVSVYVGHESKTTAVSFKNLNPDFDEYLPFTGVNPASDSSAQLDVWDWDGESKQELLGYAKISLKEAVSSEGGDVYLRLRRPEQREFSKGVQSEGIKLVESGHIIARFYFSQHLRNALETAASTHVSSQHNDVVIRPPNLPNSQVNRRVVPMSGSDVDDTLPVSGADEKSWLTRFEHLGRMSGVPHSDVRAMVDCARAYYASCREHSVIPDENVVVRIERALASQKSISELLSEEDAVFSMHGGASGATVTVSGARDGHVIAAASALKHMPWVFGAEFGGNGMGPRALEHVLDAFRANANLRELMMQSNLLGASKEGPHMLVQALKEGMLPNLTTLCVAHNRLSDRHVSDIASVLSENTTLTVLDVSHNDARAVSATALGQMLQSNTTLVGLSAGWNRLGQEIAATPQPSMMNRPSERPTTSASSSSSLTSSDGKGYSHKESLLRKDADGRWCRHMITPDLEEAIVRLQRVCGIFKLEREGDAFVECLRTYVDGADRVRDALLSESAIAAAIQHALEELWMLKKKRKVFAAQGKFGVGGKGRDPSEKGRSNQGSEGGDSEGEGDGQDDDECDDDDDDESSVTGSTAQNAEGGASQQNASDKNNTGEQLLLMMEEQISSAQKHVNAQQAKQATAKTHTRREAALFRMHRDDMFTEVQKFVEAMAANPMKDVALKSLVTETRTLPFFDSLRQLLGSANNTGVSGKDALFSGAMHNTTLTSLELQWNGLGGSRSADTCEAVAAILCSEGCQLVSLDLSCNLIMGKGKGAGVGQVLASALEGGPRLRAFILDGNQLGDSAARCLLRSASVLPKVRVSLLGCVDSIVHPYQHNATAPFGAYSLELTDLGARNMVRGMVSMICRGRAFFKDGEVRHVSQGGRVEVIRVPQTKYMQWEDWAVPESGTLIFELIRTLPASSDANHKFSNSTHQRRDVTDVALRTLHTAEGTRARRTAIESVGASGVIIDALRGSQMISLCRDLPERMTFLMRALHHVERRDGTLNSAVQSGHVDAHALIQSMLNFNG